MNDSTASPSRSEVDAEIARLAASIRSGELDEHGGRVLIYSKLRAAGIADAVSMQQAGLRKWEREDLAGHLDAVILERTLHTGPGGFSLDRVHSSSAEGWARQLARSAVRWYLAEAAADRRRHILVAPVIDDDAPLGEAAAAYHLRQSHDLLPEDAVLDVDAESAHDDYLTSTKGLHGDSRVKHAALALSAAYRVPMPLRPDQLLDRLWVTERITRDPLLAWESANAFHQLVNAQMAPEQQEIEERLLALWDDYPPDAIERVAGRDPRVAHALVAGALAPNPRPHRDAIAGAMSVMRMASATNMSWIRLCRRLLDGWLAVECDLVSERNTRVTDERLAELRGEQIAAAAEWAGAVAEVTAMPDAPFGTTEQQVKDWISSAVESFQVAYAV